MESKGKKLHQHQEKVYKNKEHIKAIVKSGVKLTCLM